ncbi:MAG: hypothetical protein MRERV_1c154 [Mycoplasmataceae bacterium RV_VA103A]|nr:MAG: hypothetical protein MRERV_1c154 [Mycoplasmataceae bacterium RV_VA103A]
MGSKLAVINGRSKPKKLTIRIAKKKKFAFRVWKWEN